MTWNLFLDAERKPPLDKRVWFLAKNLYTLEVLLSTKGEPSLVSLNADFEENGISAFELVRRFKTNPKILVHSGSPVSTNNILNYSRRNS